MNKNLKKIILTTTTLLLIPSCSSVYRGAGTLENCFPKEKISLQERTKNYIAKPDSLHTKQIVYKNINLDPDCIKVNLEFLKF